MKMKTIQTSTILIALLIILVPITTTQAFSTGYDITLYQIPNTGNVRVGDTVIVTAILELSESDFVYENIQQAELYWEKNGVEQTTILCDQILPAKYDTITWTLGSFQYNDFIMYSVWLQLDDSWDYDSSTVTFNVYPVTVTTTDDVIPTNGNDGLSDSTKNILIGVIVAITVLVVVGLLAKRRRNR